MDKTDELPGMEEEEIVKYLQLDCWIIFLFVSAFYVQYIILIQEGDQNRICVFLCASEEERV